MLMLASVEQQLMIITNSCCLQMMCGSFHPHDQSCENCLRRQQSSEYSCGVSSLWWPATTTAAVGEARSSDQLNQTSHQFYIQSIQWPQQVEGVIRYRFFTRDSICCSAYMLSPFCPSVCRMDHRKMVEVRILEIFTVR